MALPDIFLNTSWSMQYIPFVKRRMHTLYTIVGATESQVGTMRQLQALSDECCRYIQIQDRLEPRDDLNDESEKTGLLRECHISQVWPHSTAGSTALERRCLGLSIETRYQKTTYQLLLLARRSHSIDECPLSAILYKASQTHVKHIRSWLDSKFAIPSAWPLRLPQDLLPRMCSSYLTALTEPWTAVADRTDALRQASVQQLIGSLKLMITFSGTTGTEIAPNLKTLDLDIPPETTHLLLERAKQTAAAHGAAENTFLEELAQAIHEKTGLRLPLRGAPRAATTQINGNATDATEAAQDGLVPTALAEAPLKVTKITCAAFGISIDGKLKFASKPIENAEVVGYQEETVRSAYWQLLEIVRIEAEDRGIEHDTHQ